MCEQHFPCQANLFALRFPRAANTCLLLHTYAALSTTVLRGLVNDAARCLNCSLLALDEDTSIWSADAV